MITWNSFTDWSGRNFTEEERMSMQLQAKLGSCRAACQICNEKILDCDVQVTATGFRSSGSVHLKCLISDSKLPDAIKDMLLDRIAKARFTLKNSLDKTHQSVV